MVDGHLQVQGEGVADLFEEDGEKLLVEVIKEELEVYVQPSPPLQLSFNH